jgi:hypothetical protein
LRPSGASYRFSSGRWYSVTDQNARASTGGIWSASKCSVYGVVAVQRAVLRILDRAGVDGIEVRFAPSAP